MIDDDGPSEQEETGDTTCPDCGAGWPGTEPACPSCGLSLEDVQTAVEFHSQRAQNRRDNWDLR